MAKHRFKLLNSWLSKLQNIGSNRSKTRRQIIQNSMNKNQAPTTTPSADSLSFSSPTNRHSYYIPSQAREENKLLPITTKPKCKEVDKERRITRKSASSNSPRLARRRTQRKESIAVVKSSLDPQRDFRESMVEMILENNLLDSKELEDLLASYLSLNSAEYHDMIVEVFKEIWIALYRNYIVG